MREKKTINIEIGERVKKRRKLLSLSRDKLAEKTELSARFLACVENGSGGLSMSSLKALASALNVSCDYLVIGQESSGLSGEIVELLERIPPDEMELAIKHLALFIETAEHFRSGGPND